jgi:hypothetical protein
MISHPLTSSVEELSERIQRESGPQKAPSRVARRTLMWNSTLRMRTDGRFRRWDQLVEEVQAVGGWVGNHQVLTLCTKTWVSP